MHVALGHVWSVTGWPVTAKRVTDLLGVLLLLPVALPVLALCAFLVWARDGHTPLHVQWRVGRGGRPFRLWKLRSMVPGAEEDLAAVLKASREAARQWSEGAKIAQDPRVTPVGRVLRRYCLDELPQLWNVLRGDMSLVGPRPVPEAELRAFYHGPAARDYRKVLPGLTGLWQVSGRNVLTYDRRVALDRDYVARQGLWLDLWILVRTVREVLRGGGM